MVLEVTRCMGWVDCLVTSVCHDNDAFSNKAHRAHRDVVFCVFIPSIVDKQFTARNQQTAQRFFLSIYVIYLL